jgi:tRNA (cytidine/uridine-2'-O-)-methyltransferase
MRVVLVHPQIPPNTGNIARLCAATETPLHLIKPLGFHIDDRSVKRAGLDYWDYVDLTVWESLDVFMDATPNSQKLFLTRHTGMIYTNHHFSADHYLLFGSETEGLPKPLLHTHPNQCLTIPMWGKVRSLNLATSVGIVLYEAFRQVGYPMLKG